MLKIFNEQAKGATMLRKIVLTTMMALAVPTVGMAQREEHPSRGRPPGEFRGPHPGGPRGPGEFRGPRPGGPPGRFLYHGRPFNRVHIAPFVYPPGWAYRRWVIGAVLPPLFLAPAYYYGGLACRRLSRAFNGCAMDPTCFSSTWPLARLWTQSTAPSTKYSTGPSPAATCQRVRTL
jgi:hypothetical protein